MSEPPADGLPSSVLAVSLITDLRAMVQFAAASGDFNPIHYDQAQAQATGLPGIIVPGLLKAAWLGELAVDSMGAGWVIEELEISYRGTDLVGAEVHLAAEPLVTGETAIVRLSGSTDAAPSTTGQARFRRISL